MPKPVGQRMAPNAVAQQIVQRYPGADAVFLAGSIVRGEGTATSDLDIVVVTTHEKKAPYRESLMLEHWPVELFVHTPQSLERFFQQDIARRSPSLPQMCIEGQLISSVQKAGESIKARAQTLIDQGPPTLSPHDILQYRYALTDLLSDLEGAVSAVETPFIVHRLLNVAIDAYLAYHKAWSGHGKWLWRALLRAQPVAAAQLAEALAADQSIEMIRAWVEETVLAALGGPLFNGYFLSAADAD